MNLGCIEVDEGRVLLLGGKDLATFAEIQDVGEGYLTVSIGDDKKAAAFRVPLAVAQALADELNAALGSAQPGEIG